MHVLKFDFFTDSPIDFELKKYRLLTYLKLVDGRYIELEFSPWLLANEKLYDELSNFIENLDTMREDLTSKRIEIRENSLYYTHTRPESTEELDDVEFLIRYSRPLIWKSNMFGKELAKNSGIILW